MPRQKIDWATIDPFLGKMRDADIARQFGVGRSNIHHRRTRLGINQPWGRQQQVQAAGLALLKAPGALAVKAAREAANLSQREAAEVVGAITGRGWLRYESGERQIGDDRWTLFMLLTNQHPTLRVVERGDAK